MQSISPSAVCRLRDTKPDHDTSPKHTIARNQIDSYRGSFEPGDLLHIESYGGDCIGIGFVNPHARIAIHLLTYDGDTRIDQVFFEERIACANRYRLARSSLPDAYRIVFGEADQLPGLVVDRYGEYIGVQFLHVGMDRLRDLVTSALVAQLDPKGIYERRSERVGIVERLEPRTGQLYGRVPEMLSASINGISYLTNTSSCESTGLFLDQRDNYHVVSQYIRSGDEVLDAYCYTGGFALAAANQGATVSGIDQMQWAVDLATASAKQNDYPRCRFACAELPDVLSRFDAGAFDVVILDPPAPAGNSIRNILRGYSGILRKALPVVKTDGFLIASSRSELVSLESYLDQFTSCGMEAGRSLTFVDVLGQPWDFPWLLGQDSQRYLTCVIARVS